MKEDGPCLFRLGKRCERCKRLELECGSFSHEHLAENKYICSRCDNSYGSAVTLSQHIARCQGKCDQCKDSNIACVWLIMVYLYHLVSCTPDCAPMSTSENRELSGRFFDGKAYFLLCRLIFFGVTGAWLPSNASTLDKSSICAQVG